MSNLITRCVPYLTLAMVLVALPASKAYGAEKAYGKKLTQSQAVSIRAVLENPDAYVGKTVRIDGLITDVCPKRGCWIRIADEDEQTIRFKVTDGVIVFPMDVKGKRVRAEGIFERHQLSKKQAIAMAKHRAEEKGVPFDPKTVTGPSVYYQLKGAGAVVR